jgi:hypothetical protein
MCFDISLKNIFSSGSVIITVVMRKKIRIIANFELLRFDFFVIIIIIIISSSSSSSSSSSMLGNWGRISWTINDDDNDNNVTCQPIVGYATQRC